MSESPLDKFTEFMQAEGPRWMVGPERFINETLASSMLTARLFGGPSLTEEERKGWECVQDSDERCFDKVDGKFVLNEIGARVARGEFK